MNLGNSISTPQLWNRLMHGYRGYHSICREMLPAKFNFFLDEMIKLRNIEQLKKLEIDSQNPWQLCVRATARQTQSELAEGPKSILFS
jgi:hypothetical protein